MVRVAVDAQGGDHAPDANVKGALLAVKEWGAEIEVLLVGDEKKISNVLKHYHGEIPNLSIIHASEVVEMNEQPMQAVKKKKDSSLGIATRLQKEGKASALVSAGNTGAVMAYSLLGLGRLEGVLRPAIASLVPTESGPCILLDVGANVDSKPFHLVQFAIMGSIHAKFVLGKERPRVGLLSIGEESTKGDSLTVKAHEILLQEKERLNFIGNVEGRDILKGTADVVVCDGFVGNVILKFAESVMCMLETSIKKYVYTSYRAKMGAFLLRPSLRRFAKEMDYEEYGGAPLLGINGSIIICHGRSSPKAIKNAIREAKLFVERRVNEKILEEIGYLSKHSNAFRNLETISLEKGK